MCVSFSFDLHMYVYTNTHLYNAYVCIYISTHMPLYNICVYMHIYTCIYTYMHIHIYTCAYIYMHIYTHMQGFPGDLLVKNPPANTRDTGSISRLGRSPG